MSRLNRQNIAFTFTICYTLIKHCTVFDTLKFVIMISGQGNQTKFGGVRYVLDRMHFDIAVCGIV